MFSPFAVGYANALPMFGDTRVGPLEFRVNEAGAETLPAATGGDLPLRYALEGGQALDLNRDAQRGYSVWGGASAGCGSRRAGSGRRRAIRAGAWRGLEHIDVAPADPPARPVVERLGPAGRFGGRVRAATGRPGARVAGVHSTTRAGPIRSPSPAGRGLGDGRLPARQSPAGDPQFGRDDLPGLAGCGVGRGPFGCGLETHIPRSLAGYGTISGQLGFDRAHAVTPQTLQVGTLRSPAQFRGVSEVRCIGAERVRDAAGPADVSVRCQRRGASARRWAGGARRSRDVDVVGHAPASGFNDKSKDDFSMDRDVYTGYLGLDYRLQPTVLRGLAVAYSQGDVNYTATDVTKGDIDITLTSVVPYAHWIPRRDWEGRGWSARAGAICTSATRQAR